MVEIESFLKQGKISRIKETELQRYIDFYKETYQDNLAHAKITAETFPRWSIISGYYAMHDICKLLIAKVYRFKIDRKVHEITIKMMEVLLKDQETFRLLQEGYETFSNLAQDLSDAKRERVKVQYYTGSPFLKGKYREKANSFLDFVVNPFIKRIAQLLGEALS